MMGAPEHPGEFEQSGSLLNAGRRLLASVWDHAGIRLELLSLEAAEERDRLLGALAAIVAIVVFIGMALAFAGITALLAAWGSPNRVVVAVSIASGFAVAAAAGWFILKHLLAQATPLFRHSLAEWRRDVADLRAHSEAET
jgi:uncharacterized membrane protein YqjE